MSVRLTLITAVLAPGCLLTASVLSARAERLTVGATFGCDHISTTELGWSVIQTHDPAVMGAFIHDVAHADRCRLFKGLSVRVVIPDNGAGWTCVIDERPSAGACFFVPTHHIALPKR